jgi:hypothetical protein
MATKKKSKKTTKKEYPVITREQFLEMLITLSERNVTGYGTSIDQLFTDQANRLRKQLEELKGNK